MEVEEMPWVSMDPRRFPNLLHGSLPSFGRRTLRRLGPSPLAHPLPGKRVVGVRMGVFGRYADVLEARRVESICF